MSQKHEHQHPAAQAKPAVATAAAAPDPKSIMGNPARSCISSGKPSATLLLLDEVFARPSLPTGIPYPFDVSPQQTNLAQILANQQAAMDYLGPFTCVLNYKNSNNQAEPPDDVLNAIARDEGTSFTYLGKPWLNTAPWTPAEP